MRKSGIMLLAIVLLLGASVASHAAKDTKSDWLTYKGAWFSIKYPKGFKVYPSLLSPTSETGYDSAFFVSPDHSTQFYVFCPQVKGDPRDIALNPLREMEVGRKLVRTKKGYDLAITIVARPSRGRGRHGSKAKYTRAVLGTQDPSGNTTRTFAITYRDTRTLAKYRKDFDNFRASLVQLHK